MLETPSFLPLEAQTEPPIYCKGFLAQATYLKTEGKTMVSTNITSALTMEHIVEHWDASLLRDRPGSGRRSAP